MAGATMTTLGGAEVPGEAEEEGALSKLAASQAGEEAEEEREAQEGECGKTKGATVST